MLKIFFNYNKMQISFSLIIFLLFFRYQKLVLEPKKQSLKNKDEQIILIKISETESNHNFLIYFSLD